MSEIRGTLKQQLEDFERRLGDAKKSVAFYEARIAEVHELHEAIEAAKVDPGKCVIKRSLYSVPEVGRLISRTKATVTVEVSGKPLVFNIRGWQLRGQKPMRGDVRTEVSYVDLSFFGDDW